jgi:endonuclease I
MKTIAVIFLLFTGTLYAQHDYLKVNHNANLKAGPAGSEATVVKIPKGEYLFLLDEGKQTNGYYHASTKFGVDGYIYRTLVRRYQGDFPEELTGETAETTIYGEGQVPAGYYAGTKNLKGDKLKKKLHSIIKGHTVYTYAQVWDILKKTEEDPAHPGRVVVFYTNRTQPAGNRDYGTGFDYTAHGYTLNDAWNREHIFPKSHGFSEPSDTAYTDIHHLRAADRSINSARNTRSFDDCTELYYDNGGKDETECYTSTTEWKWEPPDNEKGDVARMLFYMAVRYEGPKYDLEIVDYIPSKTTKDPIVGKLSTLKRWNEQDPVDNWERKRNQIIYKEYQKNRNPFIDHPEWVVSIWGD